MLAVLPVYAQTDTAQAEGEEKPTERKKYEPGHQLAIGIDVLYPVLNGMVKNRYSYEGEAHYYLKNEYYAVAEGGWGGSKVEYPDLNYSTTNYFGRVGFNKSILYRESEHDWDMMFVGLRAAWADVSRSAASYSVSDSLWGTVYGTSPSKKFGVIWAEITLGMRVELVQGMLAGWNIRGKFMMNGKSFRDLQPLNISGFGKGDKNAVFDFNVYLSYAIRWNRKNMELH
jgi:hypothetical protein